MPERFQIQVSDAVLNDLADRLRRTRELPHNSFDGWKEGTDPAYLQQLISYWRDKYDWRAHERELNRFQHFTSSVDGTKLHFIHEKGKGKKPLPILLVHGYPDSSFRFHKLIDLLTDPASHGGDTADAFDVVVPDLPGYGFSEARPRKGGLFGFGDLLHKLMTEELGYECYAAHGGDWGSTVCEHVARSHAAAVVGIHLTDVPFWHSFQPPDDLSHAEKKYLEAMENFQKTDGAYAMIQGTRPLTPAVGLNDSPTGLAAWIVEKFQEWSDCHGNIESRFSKDELLTNVMIYWVTQTIATSFQPYRDFMQAGATRWITQAAKGWLGSDRTPTAFAIFPKDLSQPPREWAERFYNVQRWTKMTKGGHFAALEEPEALAQDMREFFRPLR